MNRGPMSRVRSHSKKAKTPRKGERIVLKKTQSMTFQSFWAFFYFDKETSKREFFAH